MNEGLLEYILMSSWIDKFCRTTHLDGVWGRYMDGYLNMDWVWPVDWDMDSLGLDDWVGLGNWHGNWVRPGYLNSDL